MRAQGSGKATRSGASSRSSPTASNFLHSDLKLLPELANLSMLVLEVQASAARQVPAVKRVPMWDVPTRHTTQPRPYAQPKQVLFLLLTTLHVRRSHERNGCCHPTRFCRACTKLHLLTPTLSPVLP